jgi:hypothetical protein
MFGCQWENPAFTDSANILTDLDVDVTEFKGVKQVLDANFAFGDQEPLQNISSPKTRLKQNTNTPLLHLGSS